LINPIAANISEQLSPTFVRSWQKVVLLAAALWLFCSHLPTYRGVAGSARSQPIIPEFISTWNAIDMGFSFRPFVVFLWARVFLFAGIDQITSQLSSPKGGHHATL
jgi:hypothetical protein